MESGDKIFFDDDGHPVAVDEIDFAEMDSRLAGKLSVDEGDVPELERQKAILMTCLWLCKDGVNAKEIGRRVQIIASKCNPETTQRELAQKLRMDEGQLSKKVKTVNALLANGLN